MVRSLKIGLHGMMGISILAIFPFCLNCCAPVPYLKTEETTAPEVKGTFTLILYGARYREDFESIAILDEEGDGYSFEVYAPEFDYTIKRDVPAREALDEAERFVSFHHALWKSRLSRIIDTAGNTIGYEVRPLYAPLASGYPDVLDVSYTMKDDKVIVRMSLKEELKRMPFDEGMPFLFRVK